MLEIASLEQEAIKRQRTIETEAKKTRSSSFGLDLVDGVSR